jgi:glycosyltransferase involved in cell wall biosynthesis
MSVSCSLIISTYNWPAALQLCLLSVKNQKLLPAEVIVADDGSGKNTEDLISSFKKDFPIPLKHVWHPDEGFRLAAIRNKAIAASESEYIVQIDGDLILHRHFIWDHVQFRRKKFFVTGSRVMLSEESTEALLYYHSIDIKKYAKGKTNLANGIRNKFIRNLLAERYKNQGRHKYYVKGCNMAFWKKDLLAVNGYNEAFTGWGREDSEVAIRLMNYGIKKQFIKMAGICYHLHHKVASKDLEERNLLLMHEAIDNGTIKAADGLSKYL